jgi:hypothetical protein
MSKYDKIVLSFDPCPPISSHRYFTKDSFTQLRLPTQECPLLEEEGDHNDLRISFFNQDIEEEDRKSPTPIAMRDS